MPELTHEEWTAKAVEKFGEDPLGWRFVCPACQHEASVADWKAAGASSGAAAFSCVGRYLEERAEAFGGEKGPCNYAGGGLFKLNPVAVSRPDGTTTHVFDFAGAA